MRRINLLMYGFMPLRREEADFLGMLLPMLDKPEGRALRLSYQEALKETFLPAMERELAMGQDSQLLYPAHADLADVVLCLLAQCWVDISAEMVACSKKAQKPEAAVLMNQLGKYRATLETLLDAPFGSVEIIPLQEWNDVVEILMKRLLLPMQG